MHIYSVRYHDYTVLLLINLLLNLKNCKAAVSRYAKKWAKEANVDRHVLRDWKETVYKFIDEKVGSLKQRKINKRKKHIP